MGNRSAIARIDYRGDAAIQRWIETEKPGQIPKTENLNPTWDIQVAFPRRHKAITWRGVAQFHSAVSPIFYRQATVVPFALITKLCAMLRRLWLNLVGGGVCGWHAEYNSAIRQIENPRYLPIRPTHPSPRGSSLLASSRIILSAFQHFSISAFQHFNSTLPTFVYFVCLCKNPLPTATAPLYARVGEHQKSPVKTSTTDAKTAALLRLREKALSRADWWLFPEQSPIKGFMGTGDIFIVGDQPSTDPWEPDHPHRMVFYNTLQEAGLANVHLTDLYKKRGLSNALENGLPDDFQSHMSFLREEIAALHPKQIVALGELAQRLLIQNLAEWKAMIPRIWHFSHVVRQRLETQYSAHIRDRVWGR